ncbi:MAG: hypothetical protein M3328_13245, partial [Chloroflexota bacterium]|nr:hypothetical protein [Chloroflexota bacterium]
MLRKLKGDGTKARWRLFIVTGSLLAIWACAMLVQWQSAPSNFTPGGPDDPNALTVGGGDGESDKLTSLEDYWLTRISYPTGKVDTRWLLEAAKQDMLISNRVPGGTPEYRRDTNNPNGPGSASPLSMSTTSWT